MKKYETRTITRTETYIEEIVCDLCNKPLDWNDIFPYGVNETEISMKEGTSYPEGGNGTEIEIDICTTCFKDKLIPWLKSQGVPIKWQKWSW